MRSYELVVLLHPDLEIDVDTPIAKIEKLVATAGGKVTMRDNWGKKRLAYKVKKHDFAVYIYFELSLPTEGARQVEAGLLIIEEVLRHLLVVAPDPKLLVSKAKSMDKEAAAKETSNSEVK